MTVEIRHLRAFAEIVQQGNLTRAAAALHMSQPALSRTLAQLETSLGVKLVSRSTHHFNVTDAGYRFARAADEALRAFDRALQVAPIDVAPLRVGQSWSVGTHMSAIVRTWNSTYPARELTIRRSEQRTAGLSEGLVDVAITRGPVDPERFRSAVIDEEARVAVLPTDHPLANASSVELSSLALEALIVHTLAGTTTPSLWPSDSRPRVAAEVTNTDDWLIAIATGRGIGVSVASMALLHPHPDVRYVPLTGAGSVSLLVVWPRLDVHPYVADFVRIARRAAQR